MADRCLAGSIVGSAALAFRPMRCPHRARGGPAARQGRMQRRGHAGRALSTRPNRRERTGEADDYRNVDRLRNCRRTSTEKRSRTAGAVRRSPVVGRPRGRWRRPRRFPEARHAGPGSRPRVAALSRSGRHLRRARSHETRARLKPGPVSVSAGRQRWRRIRSATRRVARPDGGAGWRTPGPIHLRERTT